MHISDFCISIHNSDALFQYKTYGEIKLVVGKLTHRETRNSLLNKNCQGSSLFLNGIAYIQSK